MSEEEFNKYTDQIAKTKYDININDYLIDLETNPIKSSGIGGLGIVVGIVMAIIVVTSVFCIKNSFDFFGFSDKDNKEEILDLKWLDIDKVKNMTEQELRGYETAIQDIKNFENKKIFPLEIFNNTIYTR